MSAAEVRQTAGDPKEIKPMKVDDGTHAETWIYRRAIDHKLRQVAVSSHPEDTFVGGAVGMATTQASDYRLERTTIEQVTALLMVDGKLVLARQWREKHVSYDN
jgi:hypothetical protein